MQAAPNPDAVVGIIREYVSTIPKEG